MLISGHAVTVIALEPMTLIAKLLYIHPKNTL